MSVNQNPTEFETTDIKKPGLGIGWMRMNTKSLLAVFVILAIGIMLLTTKNGKNFAGQAANFFRVRVGNFVSGLFSGTSGWKPSFSQQEQMPSGRQFLMSLLVGKASFYGQQYGLTNTSLDMKGVCDAALRVGDVMLKTESIECDVAAEEMIGTFEYTTTGTVKFDGRVSSLEVDGNRYTSAEAILEVGFEVLPIEFTLVGLTEREIVIESATGSINRMSPEGSIKSTEILDSEQLKIGGFVGFIKLEDSNIKLQGLAVSVEGKGAHSSFIW